MSSSSLSDPFNICGLIGAIIFPCALLPAIHKAVTTRSTEDVSYIWQGLFVVGLSFFIAYSAKYELWVTLWPAVVELGLMLILTILKVYYDSRPEHERRPFGSAKQLVPVEGVVVSAQQPAAEGEDSTRKRMVANRTVNEVDAATSGATILV